MKLRHYHNKLVTFTTGALQGPTVMTLPLADVPLAPPEPTSPLYSTLCTGVYPTVSVLCLRWTMTSTMEGQELSSGKGTGLTTRFASEDGKYWNMTERGCRQITKCKAGEGVSNIAVAMYDTKCTPCHPGTYSDQLSATQVCMVCTDCRALQRTTLEPCTPGQDTVCGAILIPATGPGDLQETSRPKDNSRSVPTADSQEPENNSPVTTEAIGGKSPRPVELLHQTQIAMIAGTTVTVVVLLMVAVAVTIFCFCKKRRRKAASSRQARPDPEGGSQLEHLMTVPSTGQESDAGEEEEDEDEETDPKEAVSAAGHPVQDTNDPKDNERDLSLKETNDGLEDIPGSRPEGAEGTTSLKVQDTEDPEGNERDLNTKDATYGLEELTGDGDVTVTTSLREAEEDLYKETPV